jgi:hypothetical protein
MSADTQYCPKCGSLNAHFGYRTSLGAIDLPSPTPAPALPATRGQPAQQIVPEKHVTRIPVSSGQVYQVQAPGQAARSTPPAWTGPTVDDPDVELSPTWREGMARTPRRRVAPTGKRIASPDPTTAFFLEMFGIVGFLGIGHIYAGQPVRGLLMMVIWWSVYGLVMVSGFINVSLLLFVLVICGMPALSGIWISNEVKRKAQAGRRH